jgi:FAD/FMN-containing dehydrogenase
MNRAEQIEVIVKGEVMREILVKMRTYALNRMIVDCRFDEEDQYSRIQAGIMRIQMIDALEDEIRVLGVADER